MCDVPMSMRISVLCRYLYLHDPSIHGLLQETDGGYAGSKLTVVDAGDVDELLPGALLHGLQRRRVPGPLRGVAARPAVGRRQRRHVDRRCSGHLLAAPGALR